VALAVARQRGEYYESHIFKTFVFFPMVTLFVLQILAFLKAFTENTVSNKI